MLVPAPSSRALWSVVSGLVVSVYEVHAKSRREDQMHRSH
jgi:hypothetical protein